MARRWLIAALLLLTLGGCGDEPEAEPATVPVPATSVAPPASPSTVAKSRTTGPKAAPTRKASTSTNPAGFVTVVQRKLPELVMDHRDEEIGALAQQACASLAAGRSADAVVTEVRTFGTDQASARELVKLAIDTVCPEQDRRVDEF
jgi:predicted lipid-binding transport protein (Tim44 family)